MQGGIAAPEDGRRPGPAEAKNEKSFRHPVASRTALWYTANCRGAIGARRGHNDKDNDKELPNGLDAI